jgi:hypothetical protein
MANFTEALSSAYSLLEKVFAKFQHGFNNKKKIL